MSSSPRNVIHIDEVEFVSHWVWDTKESDCGICRRPFESCCPICAIPGDDCPISSGQCKHTFHLHCIEAALAKINRCPLCRAPWEL